MYRFGGNHTLCFNAYLIIIIIITENKVEDPIYNMNYPKYVSVMRRYR